MEQSVSSLAFRGSVTEAILEAKRQKKLFVVYISGDNPESSNLERSTWTDLSLAEVLSKYCILLQISEGSADAANLSAIYPQKSSPCITVIGYNGLQLWQNDGFFSAKVLASSLEKAWLNLHLQETAASVLTAALATQKTELLAQRNSGYNLSGQGTSSSDAPSPLTDNHITYQDAGTPTASTPTAESVDEKEHFPVKKSNLEVGNDIPSTRENEPGSTHAEQATPKVNELLDPVKLKPENIVNEKVGCPVQEANLVDLRSKGKKVTSERVVSESESAVQTKSADDYKNDDPDFSISKSDVHLNIRLPDCTSLQEKFSLTSILREVKNYVDEKQEISMRSYDLAIPYPRKVFDSDDLNKTLSELGLFDRQALILVPHSKLGGYPREGSTSSHHTNANNIGSSSGSNEGYFSYVKKIISYVNPFSYIGGGTNPPSSVHESRSSTWQYRPTSTPQNSLRNVGPNQSASSAPDGNGKLPTSSQFGSNIHTLKHDEDDDNKTKDRNAFWNGNSTQYGGDSDGK